MPAKRCKVCNNMDPRGHIDSKMGPKTTPRIGPSDSYVINLSLRILLKDLAENCSFCKLLTNMTDFFAPFLRHRAPGASLLLEMEEAGVTIVELISAIDESPQMEAQTVAQLFVYVHVRVNIECARLRILVHH